MIVIIQLTITIITIIKQQLSIMNKTCTKHDKYLNIVTPSTVYIHNINNNNNDNSNNKNKSRLTTNYTKTSAPIHQLSQQQHNNKQSSIKNIKKSQSFHTKPIITNTTTINISNTPKNSKKRNRSLSTFTNANNAQITKSSSIRNNKLYKNSNNPQKYRNNINNNNNLNFNKQHFIIRQQQSKRIRNHRRVHHGKNIAEKVIDMNYLFNNNNSNSNNNNNSNSNSNRNSDTINTINKDKFNDKQIYNQNNLKNSSHQRIKTDIIGSSNKNSLNHAFNDNSSSLQGSTLYLISSYNPITNKLNSNHFNNKLKKYRKIKINTENLEERNQQKQLQNQQQNIQKTYNYLSPTKKLHWDILSPQKLKHSKNKIKSSQKLRTSVNLSPNPKQWHYHDCLALQKIQLYTSNLKLSCQSWIALDYLQLKYLRGWYPKQIDDFNPMLKLFTSKIAYDLHNNNLININQLLIRVNSKYLPNNLQKLSKYQQGISSHSILSLKKLLTIMLITEYQDVLFYVVMNVGLILVKIQEKLKERRESRQLEIQLQIGQKQQQQQKDTTNQPTMITQETIFLDDKCQFLLNKCYQKFQQKCQEITSQILSATTIKYNHTNSSSMNVFTLKSTCLDIAILSMKCINQPFFKKSLSFLNKYIITIKYQVGWKFWQTRTITYSNQQYKKYGINCLGGKNHRNNQCYVVWQMKKNIIVVMSDCKVNMHWRDNRRIIQWIQKCIPRFNDKYLVNMTFYPNDSQRLFKIK